MREIEKLQAAAAHLRQELPGTPELGLILGSGLSEAIELKDERCLGFGAIPHFPRPTILGHAGQLCLGELAGKKILVQKGRVHYYEGRTMAEVAFPVRLMKLLGVKRLIITNAAGAINEGFSPGDLVLIKDHINTIPDNPLRGENIEELGPRFPSMNESYSPRLRELAVRAALKEGLELKKGVYLAAPGPMYETPAEIQAYKRLGADLVGMSTVPEVIAAVHSGLEVLGLSCVTNMAAGIGHSKLTHEEVLQVTAERGKALIRLVRAIVREL
ncbi:MAG: purine-nucleoside phosphorylase [Candidatus Acetothermia bacterium]|jgi:purine-nucleoside phosphorylase|nr:purine-nucleoside phosphorylase [Candidatus Acetothermia bacterium]MDH7506075.1 purine-nucleoside phosphorylase [Candidatus Acetothermia bacterium]